MDHQAVLEHAPLPIIIVQDFRIVYANRSFIDVANFYGYDFDDDSVQLAHLMQLVAPEEREASMANIQQLLTDPQEVWRNVPRTLIAANGDRLPSLVSTSRIAWNGKPALVTSFVIIGLDSPTAEPKKGKGRRRRRSTDHRQLSLESLTHREQEVAHLVATGYSTDNIRALLNVEESTVRSHLKSIYKKTNTKSRLELTRLLIGLR